MKKIYLLTCGLMIAIFLVWIGTRHSNERKSESQQSAPTPNETGHINQTVSQTYDREPNQPTRGSPVTRASDPVGEYVRQKMADPQYDWKQPINFFGKIVDESNQPVANADVHFTWNDISEKGTSDYSTKSDDVGLFSITDRQGKRLYIEISKPGYYFSHQTPDAYEYANPADGLFTPDPSNPVVFHLRKKGIGADLVTSQYGMSSTFQIHIPRDGTPVKVDMMQRKVGDTGQMQLSEVKPEYEKWKQATEWHFKMEIPDGGFVEQNDEFPFEAPATGYQPVVEFNFQKSDTNWVTRINKKYYIEFGNPPRFGHLQVETSMSNGGAVLTYAINPDGSRNLEPQ